MRERKRSEIYRERKRRRSERENRRCKEEEEALRETEPKANSPLNLRKMKRKDNRKIIKTGCMGIPYKNKVGLSKGLGHVSAISLSLTFSLSLSPPLFTHALSTAHSLSLPFCLSHSLSLNLIYFSLQPPDFIQFKKNRFVFKKVKKIGKANSARIWLCCFLPRIKSDL